MTPDPATRALTLIRQDPDRDWRPIDLMIQLDLTTREAHDALHALWLGGEVAEGAHGRYTLARRVVRREPDGQLRIGEGS